MTYYYLSKGLGLTACGSFTRDRSRWITFSETDRQRFEAQDIRPFGAGRRGQFMPTEEVR